MENFTKIYTVLVCFLATQLVAGCASWKPSPDMAPAAARDALQESFIIATNNAGDGVGAYLSNDKTRKRVFPRAIAGNGVIYLVRNSANKGVAGESRFAYALLSLPQGTEVKFFRDRDANDHQDKWYVEFTGNDPGWATGYTDKEPLFGITTVELNDRHKNNHKNVLWFKSEENMKRFLNALSSLFPYLTF